MGLDSNVYSTQAQAASSSSLFEPVLSVHCLAALDLGAGVEQPIDYLIIQNRQAVQSIGRAMDGTLEDNMFNGLIFFATLKAIPHLCKQDGERLTLVLWRLSWTHAVLGKVISGVWVGDKSTEFRSTLQPFHIPSVICPKRCTSVTVIRCTDELLCSRYKRVSRFEMLCISTKMSRLRGTAC